MVKPVRKADRRIGRVLAVGSLLGVGLSTACALVLFLLGADLSHWRLGMDGWWGGEYPVLRMLGGLGMLVLGATPVCMLVWTLLHSWLAGRRREAFTGLGVLAVLGLGLLTVLAQLH